ncbi:gamma-glutamyl-gamma-aminobutyrate hydrolase family protein [Pullulanibacillus sp. KACC 23026]|uniref:gamma-glutamyl-gamma-aminobutyrate hydrolase family protein n=1 Tax=Pullulanibacillus sp. KACC 23026 TaxID=3028315 RepID=UPI0023AF0E28|nr:gamma-glutamyl-gamma-aminobutyrate hydrolase family protein [Pullulanibacillus sp. KACC 23026]WEG12593.1 gamma-glutamyl-gamma-aminobutyrate hydrolase family protein [Pullulanibacillus sp. KACC 23026]
MKPIIGVSGSHIIDQSGRWPGYTRAYVNDNYIQSVVKAGGVPYMIPLVYDEEVIKHQVENLDGLVLSGGQDVSPVFYNEEPLQKLGGIFPERDQFDMLLIRQMLAQKKPVFAICRGIQILNVAFGGSLHQDLSYVDGCYIKHNQYSSPSLATHTITIEPQSQLSNILGETSRVNSFHHQALKDIAPGFKVTAKAADGIVEAIEYVGDSYILGVQWHPEMMAATNSSMLTLFENLVAEAKKKKTQPC